MRMYIVSLIVGVFLVFGCNSKPENINRVLENEHKKEIQNISSLSEEDGLNMLKANCYSCHDPNAVSHDNMLAPPLAGIKYKYKSLYPAEDLFIAQMADFVNNPTKANSVMKGPVRRFGLMPKTTLTKTEIQELVKFVYNNEIAIPKWFAEHFEEQHNIKWEER